MRRAALALALAAAAAGSLPALADTSPQPAPQTITGAITAPVPSNVSGGPRRAALASTATNGVIGWYFDVRPETVGGTFDLTKGADPSATGDLNIIFYSNPGDIGGTAPAIVGEFIGTGATEKGVVPEGAKTGLVFISSGARVGFAYKAVPALAVPLSGALDVSVVKGAPVRFVNDTAAPVTVVAVDRDELDSPVFDAGEIAPGAAASVVLEQPGTYAYTAGERRGTLTVTG